MQVFPLETPALRNVEIQPAELDGRAVLVVRDPAGVLEGTAVMAAHPLILLFLQMADGRTTCAEMARRVTLGSGQVVQASVFESVAKQMDEALLLQTERFREAFERKRAAYLASPTRPCTVFRVAPSDRLAMIKELGDEFRRHLTAKGAPPPQLDLSPGSVAGILAPHIDYYRGGPAYAYAYRALREYGLPGTRTFIVLGTSHRPLDGRFAATRKTFETPIGDVETDTEILDALSRYFGGDLFRDEYAHANEHTVELQAIYLRHTFAGQEGSLLPPPRIVPVLVGPMDDLLLTGRSPKDDPEIAAFCAALRRVLDEAGDRVAVIGGVDMSHCGPQFGDEELNDEQREQAIETADRAALAAIEDGDPERFFETFRKDENATNVCSIAPIYVMMEAMRERAKARVLTYQQANSDDRTCLVSFASVAYVKNGSSPDGAKMILARG
ncbi:MAG: AmmeMemoRadiSam system protein B [Candidatus Sumerlaeaceae bacterium]|nr:AmmeMemoRadiSam system protein B [Candidatus Sumerlaeaceae bacterium]